MSDSIVLSLEHLSVGFHRHVDRYAHTVGLIDGDRLMPLLASVEGCDLDQWPASPLMQTINVDNSNGNQVGLLVGKAGNNHWSASVQLEGSRGSISFDVACRISSEPPAGSGGDIPTLGSAYRTMVSPIRISASSVEFVVGKLKAKLSTFSGDDDVADSTLVVNDNDIRIMPAVLPGNLPRTIRWRYSVARID